MVAGIAEGCRQCGCALVGGETAEMPGMYAPGHYDLAGFAVGAAERTALLPRAVVEGDAVLGLASSGVHSNGFSLVRRIVADAGLSWAAAAPFEPGNTLAAALMTPTRLYVHQVLALHRAGLLRAAAHITGGGLPGNVPRVLPDGFDIVLDTPWPAPGVFPWLARTGRVPAAEMLRVFNCGIGMVLVVPDAAEAERVLTACGEVPLRLGRVVRGDGEPAVRFTMDPGFLG